MLLIKQNEATAARRRIPVALVDDADGKSPETGVTLTAGDMKLSKNGGAEANHAGTLTELAGGDYYYEATQGELDTVGYLTGRLVKTDIRTFRFAVQVVAFDPYAAASLGLTNLDAAVSSRAPEAGGNVAAIKAKTDALPTDPADQSLVIAATDAIKADTAAILADTGTGGVVLAPGAITAASIADGALTAAKFAAGAFDAVWTVASRTLTAFSTGLALAVWDVLESAIATASSIGVKTTTALDAAISSRATPAQVNAEVVDALSVDTYPAPGQGIPPATASLATKLGYLFKAFRNRHTQHVSDGYKLYGDDGTTVDQKASVTDDGTTGDRGALTSGP